MHISMGKIIALLIIMISLNLGSNVEVLMSGNVRCYNIVVEAMKAFPISEKIQEVSCCLLHRLTLGKLQLLVNFLSQYI